VIARYDVDIFVLGICDVVIGSLLGDDRRYIRPFFHILSQIT
jgi:hypothetical protein